MNNCPECSYNFTYKDRLKSCFNLRGRLKCKQCNSIFKENFNIIRGLYYGVVAFVSNMIYLKFDHYNMSFVLSILSYVIIVTPILILFDLLPHKWHQYKKIDTKKTN